MQNKAQVFFSLSLPNIIMIEFHCIFSLLECISQSQIFVTLLLTVPKVSENLSLLRKQPVTQRGRGSCLAE